MGVIFGNDSQEQTAHLGSSYSVCNNTYMIEKIARCILGSCEMHARSVRDACETPEKINLRALVP